ncbi:hypothetical protein MSAN_02488900 [Mycena sanguinolenta]|uniref:Uncharacterized protein n=1 Tax=Mycena sanguinolenta TaxID=230812 RepID=A0A8H6U1S2_9AGAR|nr:hypothetical protein MSAN_02488900 [Mycena sanguinolenta]
MFSRSDHHHVGSPIPATTLTLPSPLKSTNSDRLTAQYQRLECLLESALATAVLISDAAGSAPYSDHILDVLAALSRRIAVPTTATPHPDPPTVTDSDHFPATAADTAPSLGANETKRCHVSYARAVSAETSVLAPQPETSQPDIVIRFADAPDGPPRRATPGGIFTALHDALSPTNRLFAGVRWTHNWNLIIQIEPGTGTTSFMIEKYALRIWEII